MRTFTFLVLIASIANVLAQQYTINTPLNVVVCLPTLLSWTGGQAPYFLSVNPAGQPEASPLVDLGKIDSGTAVTWIANLGVGTSAFLNLRDSTGTLAQSGTFTIQSGSGTNTTCVGQPPVVTAANGGSVSSGSSSSGSTGSTSGSGNGSSSSSSSSQSASKTASAGQSSDTSKPNGAMSRHAPAGAAALLTFSFLAFASA